MQRAWFAVKMHALTVLAIVVALALALYWGFWFAVWIVVAVALAGLLWVQSIADGWISRKRS